MNKKFERDECSKVPVSEESCHRMDPSAGKKLQRYHRMEVARKGTALLQNLRTLSWRTNPLEFGEVILVTNRRNIVYYNRL